MPNASENLLSIPKLEEQGYGARFYDGISEIFNQTDGTIFKRKTEAGKLHYLQMIVVPKDPAKSCKAFGNAAILKKASEPAIALMAKTHQGQIEHWDIWHTRLSHVGSKILRRIFPKMADNSVCKCEACVLGKFQRHPFKSIPEEQKIPVKPGEKVNCDLAGPFLPSNTGLRYRSLYVDGDTGFIAYYLMRFKSEQPWCLKAYRLMMKKLYGREVKTVHSDQGGEYTSTREAEELDAEGIQKWYSAARTPESKT